MTQRAYLHPFDDWQSVLPHGVLQEVEENFWIELDTATLTLEEVTIIRNRQRNNQEAPFCAYCLSQMKYDQGFSREDGVSRAPSFKHYRRQACFDYESLPHAETKKFVFSRLEAAGYRVYEDTRPLGAQRLHADVAAYRKTEGEEKLQLVVEVVATPPRMDLMARKMNTFAAEGVPTAWVLLLDSFFGQAGVGGGVHNVADLSVAGELTYKRQPIEPGIEDNFIVIGAENRAFSFLINQYGYAIGIFLPGYIFLIRRDHTNEQERYLRQLRGEPWDASEDVFMITRIADRDIVRTLLQTPVLRFQQEIATKSKLPPGTPRDLIGNDAHLFDLEDIQPDEMAIIDFEANKLDGEEAELAYDPLQLILQSREAREKARQAYQAELAAQAEEAAREAAREAERVQAEELAAEQAQRELEAAEDERIASLSEAPDEVRRIYARLRDDDPRSIFIDEDADWPWQPTQHRMQLEQRQWIEDQCRRQGYAIQRPEQMLMLSEAEGLHVLRAIRTKRIDDSPVSLIQDQDSVARAYAKLDSAGRKELARSLFPGGMHEMWFQTIMDQVEQKEKIERDKREKEERKQLAQERREEKKQQELQKRRDQLFMDF